jgi:hypothetical protein
MESVFCIALFLDQTSLSGLVACCYPFETMQWLGAGLSDTIHLAESVRQWLGIDDLLSSGCVWVELSKRKRLAKRVQRASMASLDSELGMEKDRGLGQYPLLLFLCQPPSPFSSSLFALSVVVSRPVGGSCNKATAFFAPFRLTSFISRPAISLRCTAAHQDLDEINVEGSYGKNNTK